ncbi:hypothetical protein OKA04_05620 [Luteolibacter flavescens]|uniref:Secreted protein n=1 Tax=Luteolibacter flavescens TaxID=1859460 RepID=A0ABT3FMJ9_9BACT|nr:hypothetical protein [Luteolibacter flavescens]MCW1884200.1 hypothetical protein [Luteolibacter flavescens]
MVRIFVWALLVFCACADASITVAWKVPVEHFAPDYQANDKVRKLEQQPGESGFFEPGDELWDVSNLLWGGGDLQDPFDEKDKDAESKKPWGGDWAVWNSRSGMLVARGGYFEILEAQRTCGYDMLPRRWLTKFELKRGPATTVLPVHSQAFGDMIKTRIEDVDIELDPALRPESSYLRYSISWKQPGGDLTWYVVGEFEGRNDQEYLIARHGSGDSGWEIRATVSQDTIGDARPTEARWIEIGGKAPQPWSEVEMGQPMFGRQRLAEDLSIAVYQAPPPFSKVSPPADLQAPEHLREWIHGSFCDVRDEVLEELGIDPKAPGFFVGIETRTGQLVFVGPEAAHQVIARELESMIPGPPLTILCETDERSGNWALRAGDGFKSMIALTRPGKDGEEDVQTFQIAPEVEGEEASVKVSYHGSFKGRGHEPWKGVITLKPGDWQELDAPGDQPSAGAKPKMRVTLDAP